jgi:hypothetical protein
VHTEQTERDVCRAGCKQQLVCFINKFVNNGLSACAPCHSEVTLSEITCHFDVIILYLSILSNGHITQ